jgi:hypothetical protein
MMISVRTIKVLSLALLLFFTASIAAEGWTEWLKSKITPKTIAIASVAGLAGAYATYCWWTKPRLQLTRRLTLVDPLGRVSPRTFDVLSMGMKLSNEEDVEVYIAKGPTGSGVEDQVQRYQHGFFPYSLMDNRSGDQLARFAPRFSLTLCNSNDEYSTAHSVDRRVEILPAKGSSSVMLRADSDPGTNELFVYLYDEESEVATKREYADSLATDVKSGEGGIPNAETLLRIMANQYNIISRGSSL